LFTIKLARRFASPFGDCNVLKEFLLECLAVRVEVTLYAVVEGREGNPESISFQMVAGPARELAVRLLEAVRAIPRDHPP
jgi:hypothetical protein